MPFWLIMALTRHKAGLPAKSWKSLRGVMEESRRELEMELAAILTTEQLESLKDMQPKRPRR